MKDKRILKASLAGAAALTLAATGATYAGWSDYVVDANNTVGADILALDIDESATRKFDNIKLAPGGERDIAFYVASRKGESVPKAGLSMTLENMVGTENGCDTKTELEVNSACNDTASGGQFAAQSLYYVQAKKVEGPDKCTTADLPTRLLNTRLSDAAGKKVDLLGAGETLDGGEGVCVQAHVFMPNNASQYGFAANNASQGDSVTFDVRFDLEQQ